MRDGIWVQRTATAAPLRERTDEWWRSPLPATPEFGPEGGPLSAMTAARIEASRGAGAALDTATQTHMENALGHNFAEVRVHADREADALSRAVGALAFTTGSDIYFRDDAYGPDS